MKGQATHTMKTQYECVFISNWPHDSNCYQCGRSREEHDKGAATLLLDDVQQHSGDGGEGLADFHRSLESRDEEANTREGQADEIIFNDDAFTAAHEARAAIAAERDAFRAALKEVDLRCVQARLASNIGKKNKTMFLLGELERIRNVATTAISTCLSPEIDEVERNRREDEKERIEKEFYANERSRAATADYEFEIEDDLDE